MQTLALFRSFDRPIQVAVLNMLANNVGFYMLVPFLAGYMAHDLGMALSMVGLVVGIRSLSQQGASVIGGSIADRIGYKQAIVIGSIFRTVAFGLFGFAFEPVGMIVGAILTGFGGALLSPAMRAYMAQEAGPRRVEAYALLDVTMHGGTLLGPIIGALLIGVDFPLVCFGAAGVYILVTLLQLRYLPSQAAASSMTGQSMLSSWGEPLRNRPFVYFALAALGYFFLYNQIYLGLPLEVERLTGSGGSVGILFTMLAVVGIFGQVPVTNMARARLRPEMSIAVGLLVMGLAFVPLLLTASVLPVSDRVVADWLRTGAFPEPRMLVSGLTIAVNLLPIALCSLLLIGGQLLVSPFVASTIATLSGGRLVGTYFGMHALVQGVGAALGNFAGGSAFELARVSAYPGLPWLLMVVVGVVCAASMIVLDRLGLLGPRAPRERSAVTAGA